MFSEIFTIEEKDRGSGAMRETIILLRNPVWWASPSLPGGDVVVVDGYIAAGLLTGRQSHQRRARDERDAGDASPRADSSRHASSS